jgi:predicted negative regulator of RcsB-dependent stress response
MERDFISSTTGPIVSRNALYLVVGALVTATLVVGYQLYQEQQKTASIDISVGKAGISIETK